MIADPHDSQVKVVEVTASATRVSGEEVLGSPATRTSTRRLRRYVSEGLATEDEVGTTLQYDHRAGRNRHVSAVRHEGRWVAAVGFVGYTFVPAGLSSPLEPRLATDVVVASGFTKGPVLEAAVENWRRTYVEGGLAPRLRERLAPYYALAYDGGRQPSGVLEQQWGYSVSLLVGDSNEDAPIALSDSWCVLSCTRTPRTQGTIGALC